MRILATINLVSQSFRIFAEIQGEICLSIIAFEDSYTPVLETWGWHGQKASRYVKNQDDSINKFHILDIYGTLSQKQAHK